MGLQQFERRLERLVEGVFARAFRSGLQPVEIGRRLTREMDLRRTMAPRGTLVPNEFTVLVSSEDYDRFSPIVEELTTELIGVAREHAGVERYVFLGPVQVKFGVDEDLTPGMLLVSGEMVRTTEAAQARLVLPEGRPIELGAKPVVIGRLPDCGVVLTDPNVSRYHAEVRPVSNDGGDPNEYEVSDMGSTNGTRVNGLPISGVQRLRDDDTITVGATTIRFERT